MQTERHRNALLVDVYRNFGPQIYRACLRVSRDRQKALDMRQEVFLKILKNHGSFKGDSSLSTWIRAITTNQCMDYLRARKRNVMFVAEENVPYDAEPVIESDANRLLNRVDLAPFLQTCLPATRLMVQLHYVEGYSHQEVAGILGYSRNAVTRRLNGFLRRAGDYSPFLGRSI